VAYESVNPNTGKSLKKYETLNNEQLQAKIAAATACFETWKKTSYAHRAKIVTKAAQLLRENVDRFAIHSTTEMGKLINESRGEVKYSADILVIVFDDADLDKAILWAVWDRMSSGHRHDVHQ